MQIAWQNRDLETVGRLAHRLKGTAGMMGFRDFTESGLNQADMNRSEQIQ